MKKGWNIMTLLLDIPEQKIRQAEAVARAEGKTLQQILEEYVDELAQQKPVSAWQHLSEILPDIPDLTENEIDAEIKKARIERRNRTRA
ncbi:hypothetical protein [Larkinella rosea]|uniref:Uncharacterized protein n=1 Tax=Larkinella rosea TaxID=2025312 RepID=A0A3P1BKB7_9BACT|nr:hypothetical protein [Larkinella rosea]RRB01014.1 hypothetical protein EHT25_22805 [Larkinella rosea]